MTRLPHTGMQVPHTRYTLSDYRELETHRGLAFRATISDGPLSVGTVENNGSGGGTAFYPTNYDARVAMERFVAQCRFEGTTFSLSGLQHEHVLDTLVSEMDLARLTSEAKDTETLTVAFDEFGWTGESATWNFPSAKVDRNPGLRAQIAADSDSQQEGTTWRYWTTSGWRGLTS